jgi:endoglucanase
MRIETAFSTFFLAGLTAVLLGAAAPVPPASAPVETPPPASGVRGNQVGYLPGWPKVALVPGGAAAVELRQANVDPVGSGRVVWQGRARPLARRGPGGLEWAEVDWSSIQAEGTYVLTVAGASSPPFHLGTAVYELPLRLLLRSYFLQRCGVALDDAETGLWHGPCHVEDGVTVRADVAGPAGRRAAAAGGWHDAGDYGKYVATGTVVVAELLSAFETCPALFPDGQLGIPESGNGRSDLLDEVAVELSWLLRMERADGAAYTKLSGSRWPELVPPDADLQPRYLYGVSTAETAKLSAAFALAARVMAPRDPAAAARYLNAARRAWSYLEANPADSLDWRTEDDSGSGKYRASAIDREATLATDGDDRFWAASELLLATGEKRFSRYVERHAAEVPYTLFEWKNAAPLGMLHLLAAPESRRPSRSTRALLLKKLLARAEESLAVARRDPFGLANDRFIWGSNKMAAEDGVTLWWAWRLTGRAELRTRALDQLHFLLGRNAQGKSFVTGLGADPVRQVSHIFARAVKRDVPGLLVGGPNELEQSGIAPRGRGPLSYADDARSYATNESAIDYNAALLRLLTLALAEPLGDRCRESRR